VVLTITGLVVRNLLHQTLVNDTRANTQALLVDFLNGSQSGGTSLPELDRQQTTKLIYLDDNGNELSPAAVDELYWDVIDSELEQLTESHDLKLPPFDDPEPDLIDDLAIFDPILIEDADFDPFVVTGPIAPIDLDDEVVGVAVPIRIGEVPASLAVTSPLRHVDDTIDTITILGVVALPVLVALIAAMTWATITRALRPVEAIRNHVEETNLTSLHDPVPVPGTHDEIDRLANTMNRMLARLDEANQAQRRFIADASHELRSPITATLATLETTDPIRIQQTWPSVSATLLDEQTRLAHLVDDLLLLAATDETGGRPSRVEDVDLDELAIAEGQRARPATVHTHIRTPHRVQGNLRLIERCLANLVDNAAHHASTRVDITVTSTAEGQPLVRIDDDGPGIPPEHRDAIFERFTRLDPSRARHTGGAGLGLAIAANIAHQHHATLTCTSNRTGGARFDLTFDAGPTSSP
jgi:signal transduction histidine kinase